MTEKSIPNRRQFLAATATGGVALLAGCSSSGTSNSAGNNNNGNSSNGTPTPALTTVSEPTRFVNASLTGPSHVTVGDSFRLALHVTNIGSETGSLDTTISVTEGSSNYSLAIDQTVKSGERITVQTEPIQFDIADTYTFTVGISDVSHTVSVRSKTGTVGTAFSLNDALKATVKDIEFRPAVRYSPLTSEQTRLLNPPAKELLAIIRVGLENVGTESASVAPDAFQLADGSVYSNLGDGGEPLSTAKIKGKPLSDLRLDPAEQRTGWVLAHIPRSKAQQTVTALYQRDGPGTPPEIKWNAKPKRGTRALPQFSIKNFQLPNSISLNQDANATVAISNEGTKARTFRGLIQYRIGNSGGWRALRPITVQIQAGETVQRNFTVNSPSSGSVTYRLAPLGVTETVKYTPPVLSFGETYESETGMNVTLTDLQATDSVVVKNSGVPKHRVKAPSGKQFVLVQVRAVTVGESESTPQIDEFVLSNGSKVFERADDVSFPLVSPVDGPIYDGRLNPDINTTRKGYLVYAVPKQVALDDLTVRWTSYLGEEIWWTSTKQNTSTTR